MLATSAWTSSGPVTHRTLLQRQLTWGVEDHGPGLRTCATGALSTQCRPVQIMVEPFSIHKWHFSQADTLLRNQVLRLQDGKIGFIYMNSCIECNSAYMPIHLFNSTPKGSRASVEGAPLHVSPGFLQRDLESADRSLHLHLLVHLYFMVVQNPDSQHMGRLDTVPGALGMLRHDRSVLQPVWSLSWWL